jgi:hypothetical protein
MKKPLWKRLLKSTAIWTGISTAIMGGLYYFSEPIQNILYSNTGIAPTPTIKAAAPNAATHATPWGAPITQDPQYIKEEPGCAYGFNPETKTPFWVATLRGQGTESALLAAEPNLKSPDPTQQSGLSHLKLSPYATSTGAAVLASFDMAQTFVSWIGNHQNALCFYAGPIYTSKNYIRIKGIAVPEAIYIITITPSATLGKPSIQCVAITQQNPAVKPMTLQNLYQLTGINFFPNL